MNIENMSINDLKEGLLHYKNRCYLLERWLEDTFTIEQIRKYIKSQDSRGDIVYNLSKENIIKANKEE